MITTTATKSGVLRGAVEEGVVVFRGVPYAEADRFCAPGPVQPWRGERDATRDAPICPQLPSRLEAVMGVQEDHEQSEDCLNLTITTPAVDDSLRPVLVWFHGGGFVTGAGNLSWYGGHRLAREGDVVVVGVTYRIGTLGYLRTAGVSDGNFAPADQLAALQWVHENIAAFGGDPGAVTIAGQSAGAHSVRCLLGMPQTRGLFHRAIIQSDPTGAVGIGNARMASRGGRRFVNHLGSDPRQASIASILGAQGTLIAESGGRLKLIPASGHMTVPGVGVMPTRAQWNAEIDSRAQDLDVIIGTTAQEMTAFHRQVPWMRRLRTIPGIGPALANAIEQTISALMFGIPSRRLARRLSKAGAHVWMYRFDYRAPDSGFGATHCVELPFILGSDAAWADAPMLAGADQRELDPIGRQTRAAWLSFVRTGAPSADPEWSPFTAPKPFVRHLGVAG
ncbi:carboxylesterase family protein [Nocardia sp. NPDC004860]|uniref:carboxylesterase/lipase family protein n=1 Tax=Nocardia sp. NPDC004860 TaxID=3154557 RepID=UPI0033A8C652